MLSGAARAPTTLSLNACTLQLSAGETNCLVGCTLLSTDRLLILTPHSQSCPANRVDCVCLTSSRMCVTPKSTPKDGGKMPPDMGMVMDNSTNSTVTFFQSTTTIDEVISTGEVTQPTATVLPATTFGTETQGTETQDTSQPQSPSVITTSDVDVINTSGSAAALPPPSGSLVPALVGGIFGALVLVIVIIFVIAVWRKQRRSPASVVMEPSSATPASVLNYGPISSIVSQHHQYDAPGSRLE